MNGLSHKQARRYMQADLDGLLSDAQRLDLETHLAGCEACRAEAQSLSTLTSRLQSEFHERWDLRQDGPSQNVLTNIRSQTRRIAMSNKVKFGFRALGGVALLVILGFAVNFVISQLRDHSTAANGTTAPDDTMPVSSSNAGDRLLAFTKAENGNADIYTIHADGSGLTNITNNPSRDANPDWSPNGKHIAFESDRSGTSQIYLMDADGSNVVQLTSDKFDRILPLNIDDTTSPWSPDGSKLLFLQDAGQVTWTLHSVDISGKNKVSLATGRIVGSGISWSPDGRHVAYIVPEAIGNRDMLRIHVIDANGNNDTNITTILPEDEDLYSWNYKWTREGNIRFVAGRVYAENGNNKFAFYEASMDGATLVEIAKTSTPLEDWWEGTTFVRGFTGETLTWLRSDGTYSEFKPYENCEIGSDFQGSSFSRRSSTGHLLYAAGCPNGDQWLYWANPDGTDIRQLLESPIKTTDGGLNGIYWSPDSRYVAITVNSSGITELYILNVREALEDPLALPESFVIGGGDNYYNFSWQPIP